MKTDKLNWALNDLEKTSFQQVITILPAYASCNSII